MTESQRQKLLITYGYLLGLNEMPLDQLKAIHGKGICVPESVLLPLQQLIFGEKEEALKGPGPI